MRSCSRRRAPCVKQQQQRERPVTQLCGAGSGIAATSVYLHFPDIEQLKYALVDRGLADEPASRRCHGRADRPGRGGPPGGVPTPGSPSTTGVYRLMFGPELPPVLAFDSPDSCARRGLHVRRRGHRHRPAGRCGRRSRQPFRLTALTWAAVHGLVSLRVDRPENFPWPPLDGMIDDTVRHLLVMPGREHGEANPDRLTLPSRPQVPGIAPRPGFAPGGRRPGPRPSR